ncbi:MAG: integrase family protein [Pseudomonadota bacterium]|nr:integrase family protein [Pseudomonadota bacterium]
MSQIRLTDEAIKRLPAPEKGTVFYADTTLRGFQIAVGRKKRTFYVLRWFNGRNVRQKVGEWCPPMFTAGQARKAAEALVGNMVRGVDPRVRRDGTLSDWLDDYIETYSHKSYDRLSADTATEYRDALNLYCGEKKRIKRGKHVKLVGCGWLKRDIRKISEEDVAALHRDMIDTPCAANHLVRVLRSIQRHAGMTPPPKFAWYKQRRRENGVKPEGRADFGAMILSIDNKVRKAIWLLGCYTGIRRENLCSLKWEQVDLKAATLHLAAPFSARCRGDNQEGGGE